jgi:hypothetical protein
MADEDNGMGVCRESSDSLQAGQRPRLWGQVRDVLRCKHYSIRTEQSYIQWIKRYIYYHGKQHPGELDELGVKP